MPDMISLAFQGSGQCQVTSINFPGSTQTSLGGPMRREAQVSATSSGVYVRNSCISAWNYDFAVIVRGNVEPRVYQFYQDTATNKVRAVFLTGNPSMAVSAGETVTALSGATGTVIEDYVAGDLFVNLQNCSLTNFIANDVLSFSGGASATLTATGFLEDNGGEWGVIYTAPDPAENASPNNSMGTGLFSFTTASGEIGICFGYNNTSAEFILCKSISYGVWTDSNIYTNGNLGFLSGIATINDGIINYCFSLFNGFVFILYSYAINPDTESIVVDSASGVAAGYYTLTNIFSVNDDVFMLAIADSHGEIKKVTGGPIINLQSTANTASTDIVSFATIFRGISQNEFYVGHTATADAVPRLVVNRFAYISGSWVSNAVGAATITIAATTDIGSQIVPASLRSGIVGCLYGQGFQDTVTTPGSTVQRIWLLNNGLSTNPGIGAQPAEEYVITDPWQLIGSATWNGTVGTATDVVFGSPHGCAVGNWVLHEGANKSYRVSATPSATALTLQNLTTIAPLTTFPNTVSDTYKSVMSWTLIGGTVSGVDPSGEQNGGGERIYRNSQTRAELIKVVDIQDTVYERFYFRIYGTGSVDIEFYYRSIEGAEVQATLTNASVGTIVSNVITGLSGDDGATLYSVDSTVVPALYRYRIPSTEPA